MNWLASLAIGWLAFAIFGAIALYIGYGFAMAAKRAVDAGLSSKQVYYVDVTLALPIILLDGMYNAFVAPVLCFDFRPRMAFRMITFKGVTFPFLELTTERLSRYNEDASELPIGRWWAATLAPFLDPKDPKGWHIRSSDNVV